MSYSYIINCERCGQPLKVIEFEKNYVVMVGENVVEACPVCGDEFSLRPSTAGSAVVEKMREILRDADG